MSTPYIVRDDPGGRVHSYIKPDVAPPPSKMDWRYDGPMTPSECFAWASFLGGACLAGAMVTFVTGGIARWLDAPALRVALLSDAASMTPPLLAVVGGSVFFRVLWQGYKSRAAFDTAMLNRLAPAVTDDESDEPEVYAPLPALPAPDPLDIEFAQCVAVLTYAFNRGGVAPVPRTDRNGTASLPLPEVGGTLDGNDYPAVAARLRDVYKLMEGGDGKHWKLAQTWGSLDALLADFILRFEGGEAGL